jgi:hypothetical protein
MASIAHSDARFTSQPAATVEICKILRIDPKYAEHIRQFDKKGSFALYHYITRLVDVNATVQVVDESLMPEIGHVRGTIINVETEKIVCKSHPFTTKVVTDNDSRMTDLFTGDFNANQFYPFTQGTMARYWFDGNQWRMSTHRKIEGEKSSWGGPTFGEMFQELKQFNDADLDKNYCYHILVVHPKNRMVFKVSTGKLVLVSVYDRENDLFIPSNKLGKAPVGVEIPQPLSGIDNIQNLTTQVNEMAKESSVDKAGIICFGKTNPIVVINPTFSEVLEARGNEQNLKSRYIAVRGTHLANVLINWYSGEFPQVFKEAEDSINTLVRYLHRTYLRLYVQGERYNGKKDLPKEEFIILQRCHNWHRMNPKKNIVTEKHVKIIVDDTNGFYVMKMVKFRKQQEKYEQRMATKAAEVYNSMA